MNETQVIIDWAFALPSDDPARRAVEYLRLSINQGGDTPRDRVRNDYERAAFADRWRSRFLSAQQQALAL